MLGYDFQLAIELIRVSPSTTLKSIGNCGVLRGSEYSLGLVQLQHTHSASYA